MSLRLPSQNKFRPNFKPGQKKAPIIRPPHNNPPTSSQTTVAPSKQAIASQNLISKSPQSTAPSASVPQPSPSPGGAPVPSQTSPAQSIKSTPNVISTPIPSSQIRAIRAGTSSHNDPEASGLTNTPTATASINEAPVSNPTAPAVSASAPAPPTPQSSIAKSIVNGTNGPALLAPPAQPPKLSLLDAARNHSSTAPSPGTIRRRTPSISSRSMRAPSLTPQPGRASSVTPQYQRAPSVTPQRAPSVTPQPRREPSVTPQPPHSSGAPPSLGVTAPSRSVTPAFPPSLGATLPSLRAELSGLPPSLGKSAPSPSPANLGFPPSLGTSSSSPAPRPIQSTRSADTAALAAAAVESIMRPRAPKQPVRKGKRRITKGAAPLAKSTTPDGEENSASGPKRPARLPAKRSVVRANTEDRVTSEDDEESVLSNESGSGEKRKSATQDGSRSRPSKRQKKDRIPGVATVSLQEYQADEIVGEDVDEVVVTMADLATTLAAQGKVSQRAIRIDEFKRTQDQKKREENRIKSEQTWKRNQIKRRKVRATKNQDRAKRREEFGKLGMNEGDVSPDEEDSEEEFDHEPERLTPESTPEPELRRESQLPPEVDEDNEWNEQGEDDEWNDVAANDNGDGDEPLFDDAASQIGQVEGEPLSLADIAAQEEAEADRQALRDLGIQIRDDDQIAQDEGEDEDDDDDEEFERRIRENQDDYVIDYRVMQERDRRRLEEERERDQGEVMEIDDETRFINANSYSKYTKPLRWTVLETELFFQVLEETGENYTLMKAYFPGRTIKQLKLKGLRENRANPEKMTRAILARKPMDKAYLSKSAGYDPLKPWDKEQALFEEAKNDADKLRRMDSERPEGLQEIEEGNEEEGAEHVDESGVYEDEAYEEGGDDEGGDEELKEGDE
ncbi:uncharacterized protein IL334_003392 [Kwoniella shivajii]|uniref:Myb-like domain-containing protein n=1 Tax=Kwoniella shivajii TaxID=564305 RepID=A0ABZ1CXS9_9TREE|nr:hypothetical protein IL334_003392 [Kwoniella shivajii]